MYYALKVGATGEIHKIEAVRMANGQYNLFVDGEFLRHVRREEIALADMKHLADRFTDEAIKAQAVENNKFDSDSEGRFHEDEAYGIGIEIGDRR